MFSEPVVAGFSYQVRVTPFPRFTTLEEKGNTRFLARFTAFLTNFHSHHTPWDKGHRVKAGARRKTRFVATKNERKQILLDPLRPSLALSRSEWPSPHIRCIPNEPYSPFRGSNAVSFLYFPLNFPNSHRRRRRRRNGSPPLPPHASGARTSARRTLPWATSCLRSLPTLAASCACSSWSA